MNFREKRQIAVFLGFFLLFLSVPSASSADEVYDSGWMDLNSNYGSSSSVCVDGRRIAGDNCAAPGIPTDCTVVDYNSIAVVDLYLDMPFAYSEDCRVEIKANYSGPEEPNETIKFTANGITGTVEDTQEYGRVISWVVNDETGGWEEDFAFYKGWNRVVFSSPGWCSNDAIGDQVTLGYPDEPGKHGIRIRCYGGEDDMPERPTPPTGGETPPTGGTPPVVPPADGECPYSDQAGQPNKQLITFKSFDGSFNKLLADSDRYNEMETNENISLSPGKYNVWLAAYDAYSLRPADTDQDKEIYFLKFKNGDRQLARSAASDDLADGTVSAEWHGRVNAGLELTEAVNKITAFHGAYPDWGNAHSVQPVCALLEKIPEAVCGNGVVEDGEECDDGNSSDADTCTSACRKTSCGDGIIQTPNGNGQVEQCDRGDTVSGDGCSATCQIETSTVPGVCGSAAATASCSPPQSGLCSSGAAGTPVYDRSTNRWRWTCGSSTACSTVKDCNYKEVAP
ncbi:MAG TPA: DUF4215 domain-containing protein [Candidatus Moranbacteria bacterium]|nr:DUF4215 domain-containing protein [Candidatus Moranbacteria bacterium]